MKTKILSLDGGGVHVILQAKILQRIVEKYPNFIDSIEIYTGTSAGALLALSIISKGSENFDFLVNKHNIEEIFKKSFNPISGLFSSIYSHDFLEEKLRSLFGNKKISDIEKKLFIPVCELDNGKFTPKFYHNFQGNGGCDVEIVDLGLMTSAAPIYFPLYKNSCDGGVVANNPSGPCISNYMNCDSEKNEIVTLSLGSGSSKEKFNLENQNWGLYDWINLIIPSLVDDNSDSSCITSKNLIGEDNYFRLNPELGKKVGLDDVSMLNYLIDVGDSVDLTELFEFIEKKWFSL